MNTSDTQTYTCRACKQPRPRSEFFPANLTLKPRGKCKQCVNQIRRDTRATRRAATKPLTIPTESELAQLVLSLENGQSTVDRTWFLKNLIREYSVSLTNKGKLTERMRLLELMAKISGFDKPSDQTDDRAVIQSVMERMKQEATRNQ